MKQKERGIIPRKVKGFRDIDPKLNAVRWQIVKAAEKVYQLYGFEHWDTPAIEFAECLGKYMPDTDSVEKGVYSFKNPEEDPVFDTKGKELRDENNRVVMENHFLSMRYDLTAPLARLYAETHWMQHLRKQLSAKNPPLFRRYQYGPVFRYEAKLDPGRFREFWQIDFDTVGTADVAADAEACVILSEALVAVGLPADSFVVKVNNRKLLKGLLQSLGVENPATETDILRIVDKADKVGIHGVADELGKGRKDDSGAFIAGLGLDDALIEGLMNFFAAFTERKKRSEVIAKLQELLSENPVAQEGVAELQKIDMILTTLGFDSSRIFFDPTLVRGMAYYTGPIFEVESLMTYTDRKGRKRQVGSICGGGRYDGLVENLLGMKVPATGASIGVDRLAELLSLAGQTAEKEAQTALIIVFDDTMMPQYQKIAAELRQNQVKTEIYYGGNRNLKKQFSYADTKNAAVAIMVGEDEIAKDVVTIKDLKLGKQMQDIKDKDEWRQRVQFEVPRSQMVEKVKELVNK